jgi:uncharacterized phiE125 gp8 family phage protein
MWREKTSATAEPLTLEEAKLHLRVENAEDDALIGTLISAAREAAETFLGRVIPERQFEIVLDGYPETPYRFPFLPVKAVVSIVCVLEDETEVGLTEGTFRLASGDRLVVDTWPEGTPRTYDAVTITVTAGTETVPARWKQAMLLVIGHWYEHRESVNVGNIVNELPQGFEMLLWPDRVVPA